MNALEPCPKCGSVADRCNEKYCPRKLPPDAMPVQPVERPRDAEAVERVAEAIWNHRENRDPSGERTGHRDDDPRDPVLWDEVLRRTLWPADVGETRSLARAAVAALGPVERPAEDLWGEVAEHLPGDLTRDLADDGYLGRLEDALGGNAVYLNAPVERPCEVTDALRETLTTQAIRHPLPWRIESDWTEEVVASDGYCIAKCRERKTAEAVIRAVEAALGAVEGKRA